ncbi:MAG: oxidase, partial [Deltaproteobacteria bacterium CG_4_10_14_0_2_um_filter_43_8]
MNDHHNHHKATYIKMWIALLILTIVTFAAAYADFGTMNIVIAMAIASVKATLVALYFMH